MGQLLICIIIFICLFVGLSMPILELCGHKVYTRKSKTMTTLIRWRQRKHEIWQDEPFKTMMMTVAGWIPLSPEHAKKMNEKLVRADLPYTAEEYYAKAALSGLFGLLITGFAALMDSVLLMIGGVIMAVWLFMKNFDQVKDILKDKYALIESEIPTFIRSVESGLKTDRDVIRVLERYNKIASVAMKSELEILLTDMNTSSVPQALMRFDSRMNSTEISRLVAALVEVDRGIDATLTLQYLAADMTSMRREMLNRELDKRPGKMKAAILPGGLILVAMMFYMLIMTVLNSTGSLF